MGDRSIIWDVSQKINALHGAWATYECQTWRLENVLSDSFFGHNQKKNNNKDIQPSGEVQHHSNTVNWIRSL